MKQYLTEILLIDNQFKEYLVLVSIGGIVFQSEGAVDKETIMKGFNLTEEEFQLLIKVKPW